MKHEHFLIECLQVIKDYETYRSRFFLINPKTQQIKDVTNEMCFAIEDFNYKVPFTRFEQPIPYRMENGIATVHLENSLLTFFRRHNLDLFAKLSGSSLSFSILECEHVTYFPDEVSYFLKCGSIYDDGIEETLLRKYKDLPNPLSKEEILETLYFLTRGTHDLVVDGNKIQGRKLISGRSWASFTLTFLKSGDFSFLARQVRKRFLPSTEKELQEILVGFEVI